MRLTQTELADKVGVSKSAIAKWETNGGLPDRDNLRHLAGVLGVSVDELHRISDDGYTRRADVNITGDVIAALESYGYTVIGPDSSEKGDDR